MDKETFNKWAWRLALGTAIIVGILSWQTDVGFLWSIIRMILSFLLMYGLSYGSLYGFEKAAPLSEEISEDISGIDEANGDRGVYLDVAVGQEEFEPGARSPEDGGTSFKGSGSPIAGQVAANLSEGISDTKKQAEMVQRMGWGE